MRRATLAVLSLALAGCAVQPEPPSPAPVGIEAEAAMRGSEIARAGCASCHGVGYADESPLPAAAPLRDIARRRDLVALEADFAQGLVTAHPDMPAFVWRAAEIDDLIAYLESLRVEGPSGD
jgi:mono/diheme cytochrome c family protein